MIGKVKEYEEVTYIIKFTVPGYIEEAEAIPLNQWDRPNKDDEVYIFQDDELFGGQYCYFKMGSRDDKIHHLQTDMFEVTLDEDKEKLTVAFDDKFTLEIDAKNDKIKLDYDKAETTLNVKKLHLGDNQNQPAIMFDKYKQRWEDMYKLFANHTHGTSMGPSTAPLPPDVVKAQAQFPQTLDQDKSQNVDIMK